MIVNKSEKKEKTIEIDLTGPEGNAFALMGYANQLAKASGYTTENRKRLIFEMKSGDYENLVALFDKAFGHVVTLYR